MDLGELEASLVYLVSSRKLETHTSTNTDEILSLKTLIGINDGSGLILIIFLCILRNSSRALTGSDG